MIDNFQNSSEKARILLESDTIMFGETAMVGFNSKMVEEMSKTRTLRRPRFRNLFVMKSTSPLYSTGSSKSDDDTTCSEDHEENVRRVVDDTDMFRKMQETLRESKFSTNQGIKHELVKYFQ